MFFKEFQQTAVSQKPVFFLIMYLYWDKNVDLVMHIEKEL